MSPEYIVILVSALTVTIGALKWMLQRYHAHIETRFDSLDRTVNQVGNELHQLGLKVAKLEGSYHVIDRFITQIIDTTANRNQPNKPT